MFGSDNDFVCAYCPNIALVVTIIELEWRGRGRGRERGSSYCVVFGKSNTDQYIVLFVPVCYLYCGRMHEMLT